MELRFKFSDNPMKRYPRTRNKGVRVRPPLLNWNDPCTP
jgi:hypothetical protein